MCECEPANKSISKMGYMNRKLIFIVFVLMLISHVSGQTASGIGERYALIVGGVGGLEKFSTKYFEQTNRLYRLLVDSLQYKPDHVTYLLEDTNHAGAKIDAVASAKNVRKYLNRLVKVLTKEDQLLVVLIGHGSFDGQWSKFNLVGPDLREIDYAQMLGKLQAGKIIFIDTSGASGPFVTKLSAKNRIVITATKNGLQHHETTFADFLLDALHSEAADVNKDKRISVSEAFRFARTSQDTWYAEKHRIRAEHPLLDDNGDGEGSQFLDERSKDGRFAKNVYLGPVAVQYENVVQRVKSGSQSPEDKLVRQKINLERKIEDLKSQKNTLPPAEYAKKLETYLIELAKANRKLKAKK